MSHGGIAMTVWFGLSWIAIYDQKVAGASA
jgi:hypothetical protein